MKKTNYKNSKKEDSCTRHWARRIGYWQRTFFFVWVLFSHYPDLVWILPLTFESFVIRHTLFYSLTLMLIIFKWTKFLPWLMCLSGLNTSLRTKRLLVQFPVRAHAWVVGQVPGKGRVRGNHTLVFLSLSFLLPALLSKNKFLKIFKKWNKFYLPQMVMQN